MWILYCTGYDKVIADNAYIWGQYSDTQFVDKVLNTPTEVGYKLGFGTYHQIIKQITLYSIYSSGWMDGFILPP